MFVVQGEKCFCAKGERCPSIGETASSDCDSPKKIKVCVMIMW